VKALARPAGVAAAVAASLAAGVWIGARAGGASAPLPGSSADPLVTRSYVAAALDRVLAESGGRMRALPAGAGLTLARGSVWTVVAGTATVGLPAPPAPSAGSAPSGLPAPPPLVDLTLGRAFAPASAPAPVPADHLFLTGVDGVTVTAAGSGALLWLSGPPAAAGGQGMSGR
jgi:hypothetical protein